MNNGFRACAAAGVLLVSVQAAGAADLLGPLEYRSVADSPFAGLPFLRLDDFESATRTPGYSASAGVRLAPGDPTDPAHDLTDSVDADDGLIDGDGRRGHSWFTGGATNALTFTFDAAVLGRLPTHAGIVWTDVGNTDQGTTGTNVVLFEAFGPGGVSLGQIGPFLLGTGSAGGGDTDEDRFFGAINPAGISAITISMPASTDWEVDHLQFVAAAVPEPGQWLLMALGLGAIGWRFRARMPAR